QTLLDELDTQCKFQRTLVTIKKTNVHPREVFKELGKQGGIAIEPHWDFWGQNQGYNLPKKISVDIDKQPFWLALMDVAGNAKVGTQNYGQGHHIALSPGGGNNYDGVRFLS